jgi:hypothetical protein
MAIIYVQHIDGHLQANHVDVEHDKDTDVTPKKS